MYLVADSGATKCDWALVAESGVQRLRTRGLNPAVQEAAYMRRVLASELGADAAPEAVWFYGAGCSARFPEAMALMRTLLGERFPSARIGVESDLLGRCAGVVRRRRGDHLHPGHGLQFGVVRRTGHRG